MPAPLPHLPALLEPAAATPFCLRDFRDIRLPPCRLLRVPADSVPPYNASGYRHLHRLGLPPPPCTAPCHATWVSAPHHWLPSAPLPACCTATCAPPHLPARSGIYLQTGHWMQDACLLPSRLPPCHRPVHQRLITCCDTFSPLSADCTCHTSVPCTCLPRLLPSCLLAAPHGFTVHSAHGLLFAGTFTCLPAWILFPPHLCLPAAPACRALDTCCTARTHYLLPLLHHWDCCLPPSAAVLTSVLPQMGLSGLGTTSFYDLWNAVLGFTCHYLEHGFPPFWVVTISACHSTIWSDHWDCSLDLPLLSGIPRSS